MLKKTVSLGTLFLGVMVAAGVFWQPSAHSVQKSPRSHSLPEEQSPKGAAASALLAQSVNKNQIERIIKEYLIKNPEVLVEAMQALEKKRNAERETAAQAFIRKHSKRIYADSEDPVGGNPNGDVTIVEFFDYQCEFCKRVAPMVEEALAKDGQIRIVYKEFPILGPNSVLAARAALASRAQGKYLAFHKALMETRISYDEKSVMKIAAALGINTDRLKKDMLSSQIQEIIDRNRALARSLRIRGTPAFIVGEQLFPGALTPSQLARMIQEARKN